MEWDYLPPVGPRPHKGFVGLKNAGATCYMNSVLQQLYMVESIRGGLLAAEGAATDLNEDFSGDERPDSEVCYMAGEMVKYLLYVACLNTLQFIFRQIVAYNTLQSFVS